MHVTWRRLPYSRKKGLRFITARFTEKPNPDSVSALLFAQIARLIRLSRPSVPWPF
jgi:hypothetical protein